MLPHGVSIALIEPKGPVNVGHVARLVQNFGVERLYLVNPQIDLSVAAIYASHASHVLDDAIVTTLKRVRKENELLVATTAVRASKRSNVIRRTVAPERLHDILSRSKTSSLIFGRDTTGLNNKEIEICDLTTTIDTSPAYRALNIGHAAAIILYMASKGEVGKTKIQGKKAREVFARSFYDLAEGSRIPEHKMQNLYEVSKRIVAGSGMTDNQLNLFSGVFRKAAASMKASQRRDSKA